MILGSTHFNQLLDILKLAMALQYNSHKKVTRLRAHHMLIRTSRVCCAVNEWALTLSHTGKSSSERMCHQQAPLAI